MKTLSIALASVFAIGLGSQAIAADPVKLVSDQNVQQSVQPYHVSQARSLDRQAVKENPTLSRVDHDDVSGFATASGEREHEQGGFDLQQLF